MLRFLFLGALAGGPYSLWKYAIVFSLSPRSNSAQCDLNIPYISLIVHSEWIWIAYLILVYDSESPWFYLQLYRILLCGVITNNFADWQKNQGKGPSKIPVVRGFPVINVPWFCGCAVLSSRLYPSIQDLALKDHLCEDYRGMGSFVEVVSMRMRKSMVRYDQTNTLILV